MNTAKKKSAVTIAEAEANVQRAIEACTAATNGNRIEDAVILPEIHDRIVLAMGYFTSAKHEATAFGDGTDAIDEGLKQLALARVELETSITSLVNAGVIAKGVAK